MSTFDYSLLEAITELWFITVLYAVEKANRGSSDTQFMETVTHSAYDGLEQVLMLLFAFEGKDA